MRLSVPVLAATIALPSIACVGTGSSGGNSNDEIDCTELTCDWITVEGDPIYGATWHDGDLGVDLSAQGKTVIELKDVFFANHDARQLKLRAVITRDPSASMTFALDFYAPGQGQGQLFWDRNPVFLVTRTIDVTQQGTFQFMRPVLVPSEGAAVVLRVIKDGGGPATLDELELGS